MQRVFEKGFGPCANYDSCNHVQYSLQLNLYKYILESKYDKVIVGMMLVILHPTNKTYKLFPVADMQADIHRMLASKDNPKGEGSSASLLALQCLIKGKKKMAGEIERE